MRSNSKHCLISGRRSMAYILGWSLLLFLASTQLALAALVRQPYLQSLTSTSVTIVWRTDSPAGPFDNSRVQFGTTQGSLGQSAAGVSVVPNFNANVKDHFVTISGLNPGTKYFYNVGTTGGVEGGGTAEHYFVTAPAVGSATPFTVWALGDSGDGTPDQLAVRDAMLAATGGNPPEMILHLGDVVYEDGTDAEFTTKHFNVYQDIFRHTVSWPSFGNHEAVVSDGNLQTGPYFEAHALPTAGQAGGAPSGSEAYYSFDYGNTHFVVLDSQDNNRAPGSPMLTWLQADLAATTQKWIIAYWHHPPYTKGTHNSDSNSDSGGRMVQMRENVLPILEAGGVDLVLTGHSHNYERSFLINSAFGYGSSPNFVTPSFSTLWQNGDILDERNGDPLGDGPYVKDPIGNQGTVYVVAGHGGRFLGGGPQGQHPVNYFTELLAHGSLLIDVTDSLLTVHNLGSDGVITDVVAIDKSSAGGPPTKVVIRQAGANFPAGGSTTLEVMVQDAASNRVSTDNSTQITFDPTSNGTVTGVVTGTGDGSYGVVGGPETVTVVAGIARITLSNNVAGETFEVAITNNGGLTNPANDSITVTGSTFVLEAESGSLTAPMVIGSSSTASGGQYVEVPNGAGNNTNDATNGGPGQVGFSINIPSAATYALWARTIAPGGGSDSFYVTRNNNTVLILEWTVPQSTTWQWNKIANVSLSAANFNLEFRQREDGTRLDQVLVTSNLNLIPGNTPNITNLNPTSGAVGTSVVITGTNFGATQQTSTVTFNGIAATPSNWSATSITAPVPAGASTGNVVVTVGSVPSNNVLFTVTTGVATKLAVTSVNGDATPTAGLGFPVVVEAQDAGGAPRNVTANTAVTLTRKTGTGTLGGTLSGTITAGTSQVSIAGVTYTKAESGVVITATRTSGDVLTAGDSAAFTVNPGAASALVFTTQPGAANAGSTIPGPPTVTVRDSLGNTVTTSTASITVAIGTNPSGGTLSGTLTKNAVSGVASFSDLSINQAGTGYTLTAASASLTGATSSGFNINASAPTITSIAPNSGPVGGGQTGVVITGTNLSGAITVTFGGTAATITGNTATTITVTTPAHAAGAVNVVATVSAGTATSTGGYTYIAGPTITSVAPNSGPVGGGQTGVVITGTSLSGATAVTFGGTAATITGNTATTITVTTPAHAAGAVNVVATVSAGTATSTGGYTYIAGPTITSVVPNSGPVGGGQTGVVITGTSLSGATAVTFGGTAATITGNTATTITVTTPAHAAGAVNVVATVSAGTATSTGGYTYIAGPTITSVVPNSGPVAGGQTGVVITGTSLSGATAVTFGGTAATITGNTATTITVTTPAHAAGAVDVVATVSAGTATSTGGYTYTTLPPNTIVFEAESGTLTAPMVIQSSGQASGGQFVQVPNGGGNNQNDATFGGPGQVDFAINISQAGTYALWARTIASTTGNDSFYVTRTNATVLVREWTVPVSTNWQWNKVTNVSYTVGAHTLQFRQREDGTQLDQILITTDMNFVPGNSPTITRVVPNSGPVGGGQTGVVITGTSLSGATAVTFGGTAATITGNTATTITVTTPAHAAGAVDVVATVSAGTATSTGGYTYIAGPTITSVAPNSGPVAGGQTGVVITGTSLSGATAVTFGGTAATITGNTATTITVTTPAHAAGAVDVVATVSAGTATSTGGYTYIAGPTITSVVPNSGPVAGGQTGVVITGTSLSGATAVTFGGTAATITGNTATTITVTTPAHAAGAVDVVATVSAGTATSTGGYTYIAGPTITSVAPNSGPVAGGQTGVVITGTSLSGATAVTFGGTAATITGNTATTITVTTPAHAAGAVDVVATVSAGTATSTGGYTYIAGPTITSVVPNSGPVAGGQTGVVITGTSLSGATAVTFGGTAATITGNTATTITVTTPAHAAGAVDVVATVSAGTATSTGGYTYTTLPPNTIVFEAESGTLTAPMVIQSSGQASGGQFVQVPNGGGNNQNDATFGGPGQVDFAINISQAGTYALWARTIASTTGNDSFYVTRTNATVLVREWTVPVSTNWQWNKVTNVSYTVGAHTLQFRQREDGTQLDQILITTDMNFVPQ